jgi:F0F1-type ATP synthase assembly protein I
MDRRQTLKLMGAFTVGASAGWLPAFSAENKPKMVVVHKLLGIPAITAMAKGVVRG